MNRSVSDSESESKSLLIPKEIACNSETVKQGHDIKTSDDLSTKDESASVA